MGSLDRSTALWARSRQVIPMGTQTLSKGPTQFVQGVSPIYLERGRGAHVWDVDGNEYLDYPLALGPVLLGYAEPAVDEAIIRQLRDGITFSLMHPLEVEVAERIVDLCPGVEAVRFGKTGSDALSAAVRLARAHTGRDHVLVAGYHGWHDWYIGTTTRASGVPVGVRSLTHSFLFNDLSSLEARLAEHRGQVAAVVMEPAGAETPAPGYLQAAVDLAHGEGALAIFDEVIVGFRISPGGARSRYGVIPDLSCYGKALGNGMPISAVAGPWSVMKRLEDVFFSGTHGGEALSLAAARVVLATIADGGVLAGIETLGQQMLDGLHGLIRLHGLEGRIRAGGEPHRAVVGFHGENPLVDRSWVQQCLVERGILFNGSMFICARHTPDDITRALVAFDSAFAEMANDTDLSSALKGPAIEPIFSTR